MMLNDVEESSDAEWDSLVAIIRTQMNNNVLLVSNSKHEGVGYNNTQSKHVDHRNLPRNERTEYDYERALQSIYEDFLGMYPRFKIRTS